jgi:hypothetical protein
MPGKWENRTLYSWFGVIVYKFECQSEPYFISVVIS